MEMLLQNLFTHTDIFFLPAVEMKKHTSIGIGGPAEIFTVPKNIEEIRSVLEIKQKANAALFILGGGSNIIVSDWGIPGIIMSMEKIIGIRIEDDGNTPVLHCGAGIGISDAADYAAREGYSGIDFLYSMPGTVGGALWTNARCYGREIADVLVEVGYLDHEGNQQIYYMDKEDFAHKISPFQSKECIILSCTFRMQREPSKDIFERMEKYKADRSAKGHFNAPSAGSVFKNNPLTGAPSGVIIDSMQMRGSSCGDAQISNLHANILINKGDARASDVLFLIEHVERRLMRERKIKMEREILLVGDWTGKDSISNL